MASAADIFATAAVEALFAAGAGFVLYRIWGAIFGVPRRHIVMEFQRGVILQGGKLEKIVGPGQYWITPKRTLLFCDMRQKPFQIQDQELFTADQMGVRISLGGEYKVGDPATFTTGSSDPFGTLYLEVRQALRVTIGEIQSDTLLSGRASIEARLKELLAPRAEQLGVELTQMDVYQVVPVGWLRQQ